MPFCITLIHRSGGHSSCTGDSPAAAKQRAMQKFSYYAGNCVFATMPYEFMTDASMPQDVREAIGEELVDLYVRQDG